MGGGPILSLAISFELASYARFVSGLVDSSFFDFFRLFFAILFSLSKCPSGAMPFCMQLARHSTLNGSAARKLFGIFSAVSSASTTPACFAANSLILSFSVEIFSAPIQFDGASHSPCSRTTVSLAPSPISAVFALRP